MTIFSFGSPARRIKPANSQCAKTAALLALAVLTASSFGQVREVPQGHMLDANPQVGSGGSNTPVPGYAPINGNAIIYGQVSGLARFHGPAAGSPDVFQGNLPSAQINDFARRSAPSGPGGAAQPYILPSTMVSTAGGALYSSPINGGFDARLLPANTINPATVGSGAREGSLGGAPYRVIDTTPSPAIANTALTPGNIIWSPLFSQRPQNTQPLDTLNEDKTPGENPKKPNTPDPLQPKNPNLTNDPNAGPNTGTGQSRTAVGQVGSELVTGAPDIRTSRNVADRNNSRDNNGNPTGIGQTGGRPRDLGRTAMVNDTYHTLLTELEKARADAEAKAGTAAPAPPKAIANPNDVTARTNITPRSPDGTLANGRPRGTGPRTIAAESTNTLRAGRQIAPLTTLAPSLPPGGIPTPFDAQLKEAETLLKDGKYLDAVDTYQQALIVQPENALALVGRAHAELAAGMYQSAAFDLKFLYGRKPEMAAVRYALGEFIPAKRVGDLMNDLLKLTTEDKSGNTASFLYCYLAYNTDHPTELKDELERWAIRPAHDEWQGVAAKAWSK